MTCDSPGEEKLPRMSAHPHEGLTTFSVRAHFCVHFRNACLTLTAIHYNCTPETFSSTEFLQVSYHIIVHSAGIVKRLRYLR